MVKPFLLVAGDFTHLTPPSPCQKNAILLHRKTFTDPRRSRHSTRPRPASRHRRVFPAEARLARPAALLQIPRILPPERRAILRALLRLLRACINDVPEIRIGKSQNQNWALIGRGSKTSRLRYLIFRKSLPNQRSPRGLILNKIKINIGGVHLIEGFPNATRQRPEARAQQFYNSSRRQTAPLHHTHNFCWHGPRQRSHGKGEPLLLPAGGGDRSNEWC